MAYVAAVRWSASAGSEQRLEAILAEMAEITRAERGCLMYEVHRSVDDAGGYFLYEQFVDEAAYMLHIDSEHYRRLILGEALQLLDHRVRRLYGTMAVV